MQAEKKARNEKFIFPHVEVLFIFMLFHVGGEGKGGGEGASKIYSAASWVCYGSENIDFPSRSSKKCVLIVCFYVIRVWM